MLALRRGIWAVNARAAELFHRRGSGGECRRGKSIHSLEKSIAPMFKLAFPWRSARWKRPLLLC